jgi:hypothetical protein
VSELEKRQRVPGKSFGVLRSNAEELTRFEPMSLILAHLKTARKRQMNSVEDSNLFVLQRKWAHHEIT